MEGGNSHEHLARVVWEDRQLGSSGDDLRAAIVRHIEAGGNVHVSGGTSHVQVVVADATPKYIRTRKDGKWTDNLLALPSY